MTSFLHFLGEKPTGVLAAETNSLEALVKLRNLPTCIDKALRTACPSRVRFGIDVELHCIAWCAPCGAGRIGSAVGHHNVDFVIIRVNIFLQRISPAKGCDL